MSLAELSAKLYTIKSRKNVPLSTAFSSLIREDIAARFSVYNMVKSLTGSEIISQTLESKYGFRTPQQKADNEEAKRKQIKENRFKKYAVSSILSLNSKVNTLAAITERNTILIENLYRDLGSFRTQKRFVKSDLNSSAIKTPLRSRTVKFQIDQIKNELIALKALQSRSRNRGAKKLAMGAAAGAIVGGGLGRDGTNPDQLPSGGGLGRDGTNPNQLPPDQPSSSDSSLIEKISSAADIAVLATLAVSAVKKLKPGTPPTAPKLPARVDYTKALKFAKTAVKTTGVGYVAGEISERLLGGVANLFQGKRDKTRADSDKIAKIFGLTLVRGENGNTVAYEIDGKRYKTYDELPVQYKNIIDAYLSGDQRSAAARKALSEIAQNSKTYDLLKTTEGRAQVLFPPIPATQIPAAVVAAAAPSAPAPSAPAPAPSNGSSGGSRSTSESGALSRSDSVQNPSITQYGDEVRIGNEIRKGGTVSWRTNNPGNVSYGKLAKQYGAIGRWMKPDGDKQQRTTGIAIMPTYEDGLKLKMALWRRPLYQNDTLDQGVSRWTKGDPTVALGSEYAESMARAAGVSVDFPIKNLSDSQLRLAAIKQEKFEGFREGRVLNAAMRVDAPTTSSTMTAAIGVGGATAVSPPYQTASMIASSNMPLLASVPGATVATPPVEPTIPQSKMAESTSEVAGFNALAAVDSIQNGVIVLSRRITDLEMRQTTDKQFPSVRNSTGFA